MKSSNEVSQVDDGGAKSAEVQNVSRGLNKRLLFVAFLLIVGALTIGFATLAFSLYLSSELPRIVAPGEIVYTVAKNIETTPSYHLEVRGTDGVTRTLLSNDKGNIFNADVSVDGWVFFISERDGATELYLLDPAGVETQLTNGEPVGTKLSGRFSPDGQQVAFTVLDVTSQIYSLWIINRDGSGLHQVIVGGEMVDDTNRLQVVSANWLPDGKSVIFSGGNPLIGLAVFTMSLTADAKPAQLTEFGSQAMSPVFSPDGTKVAFQMRGFFTSGWQMFTMNSDGLEETQLTDVGNNGAASWTYDGKKILFYSTRDGNLELYIMNADGTNVTNLTNTPDIHEGLPVIVPGTPAE